jgi:hypothetical protein
MIDAEEKEKFIQILQNEINNLLEKDIQMLISYKNLKDNTTPITTSQRTAYFE